MAVGAGAALLRSAATKMARAPPRLPSALERHGRRLPTSSRLFSTSSGSTPTRGPQTDIKKVRSGSRWDRAKTVVIETATMCAFLTVPAVVFIRFWVNPALDRINAEREARNRLDMEMLDEIKRGHQRIREQIDSIKS